ncbi:metal-dependent hydrolase, beta-lactamase superfamily I [Sphaerochaeta pleomorpha str. Grapes]|uniref:Metal-dependent hydrolase, beta-lactamase superfamily I n=1 Tax=Sphaerochaeta pleomorpha (strain ATCC BAA-1885 / DSM 22778 / Grapes) TaxID=158190 RepID=G8QSQ0_SPHPG|nr:MBL fold metallo-hydrolase [Sphaerochaeta pleomorpha]AEV29011.1 metal-dependent hydrolase, beta-lactamase superfamily I [Sphaerochaeta pleomorpha str. Grapes]
MKEFSVTFLGTGTSHGIPVIGCECPVCRSTDSRDKRYRSSILLTQGEHSLLIDTTPEFRLQALRSGIKRLDGVLYTHDHADHFNGIDDLRVFCRNESLPVYCSGEVSQTIQTRFNYVLGKFDEAGGVPHLEVNILEPYKEVSIAGFPVLPIPIFHGNQRIFAFRIGSFIYATDCSGIPSESLPYFQGVDTLVVGSLRYSPHPTHWCVFEATAFAHKVGARRTFLTHMCHDLSHGKLEGELPQDIRPAYDTLTITIGE